MSLDEKLEQILGRKDHPYFTFNKVEQIKQAFVDEGWLSPNKKDEVQKMVNQMAQLANDLFRIPTVEYVQLNKAQTKAKSLMTELVTTVSQSFNDAARRASGLEEKE